MKPIVILFTLALCLAGSAQAQQFTFHPMYFEKGSVKINQAGQDALERVAQILKSNPGTTLRLVAYAGKEKEDVPDYQLAENRGRETTNTLIKKYGVPAEKLDFIFHGVETKPENQRVEFEFISKETGKKTDKNLEEIEVLYWNTLYHCLYQIGKDIGAFEKEGFNIKLVGTNHSYINQVNAVCGLEPFLREKVVVFSGAVCGGSPHHAAAMGVPLVVIGGMLAGGSMLMAKPELAQKLRADPKKFKGLRIGRPKGTVLTAMIVSNFISKHGVDWKKDITWKEFNSHEDVIDALAKGTIDAGDTYVPLNIRARKQYGLVEVYNTVELFPYHPCCRVITTQAKLKENRPKYVRFMKAIVRAHEYFIKQPVKAMEIVQRYTGYTPEEVRTSLTNPNFILNPDPLKNGFVKFWKMMNETGYLHSNADINKYIDTTVYEDALKELISGDPKNPYYSYMMKQFKEQNF